MMRIFVLSIALLFATNSQAWVQGGSNLSPRGYPDHYCYKPSVPFDLSDSFSVDSYNQQLREYIQCINDYVDNAKNDIKRITESANNAIDEANSRY